jgi:hypothetical protein
MILAILFLTASPVSALKVKVQQNAANAEEAMNRDAEQASAAEFGARPPSMGGGVVGVPTLGRH